MAKKKTSLNERLSASPVLRSLVGIVVVLALLVGAASLAMHFGTRHGSHRTVPEFAGMRLADAERLARREGLNIIVNDSLFVPVYEGGTVLDQLPKGGVEVKAGRKVYVTINSFRQKSVKVPYVAGRSLRQAKNMLEAAGLEIARLQYVDDIATNYVLEEYLDNRAILPESNIEAEMGTGVTLIVGVQNGYGTASVPKLTGLTLPRAKSRLWEMGLNVGRVTYDAEVGRLERAGARVYYQSVGQSRAAMLGSAVDLKLTADAEKISASEAAAEAELQWILRERQTMEQEADSLRMLQQVQDDGDGAMQGGAQSFDDDDDFFR